MNIIILTWIFLILLGLIFKKVKFVTILQMIFVSTMIALNNGNADQKNYIDLYNQLSSNFQNVFSENSNIGGNGNFGFNFILYLSSFFKQYNWSIFFISIITMVIFYKGMTFYTSNTSTIMSLYLLSPFVIDTVQLKNFIAAIVWVYFSRYLFLAINGKISEKNKNIIKYLIGVIITSSIHFVFSFTILYILIAFVNEKNIKKFIGSLAFTLVILSLVLQKITSIINVLASTGFPIFVAISSKFRDYGDNFAEGDFQMRIYIVIIIYILMFICLFYLMVAYRKNNIDNYSLLYFVLGITVISILILPLMRYSSDIYRVQRNLLVLYYILFSSFRNNKVLIIRETTRLNYINFGALFLSILLAFSYFYIEDIYWYYDSVFRILFRF